MLLLSATATLGVLALIFCHMLWQTPGPIGEKIALSFFFLFYIGGVLYVALEPELEAFDGNPQRIDSTPTSFRPGCSSLYRSATSPGGRDGMRIIMCT